MRRSRSHLKNLTAHASQGMQTRLNGIPGGGSSQYSDEIQRRIDAIGNSYPMQPEAATAYPAQQPMPPQVPYQATNNFGWADPYSISQNANMHPPLHADMAPPHAHQPAPYDGTMEQVRMALMQMSNQLQAMGNPSVQAQKGHEQEAVLAGHVNSIASELVDLKAVVAAALEKHPAAAEIENIKQAINSVGDEIRENSRSEDGIDPNAYANVVEASHEKLARQINEIQQALVSSQSKPDAYAKTLEVSHEELRSQIENLHQAYSVGRQEQLSNEQASEAFHQRIVDKLDQIGSKLTSSAGSGTSSSNLDVESIETRLEDINRAIVALSHGNSGLDQLERLEARISDLSKSLESQAKNGTTGNSDLLFNKLETLQNRVENLAVFSSEGGEVDNSALLSRLDQLVDRVSEISALAPDSEPIRILSDQMATIESRIESFQPASMISDPEASHGIAELGGKITGLEEQFAANREISIEMASQVAEEAVQRVISQLDSTSPNSEGVNSEILRGLASDIQSLQERTSEASAETANTFQAMRQTLEELVDRLGRIDHSATAPVAPQLDGNPAEQLHVVNRPDIQNTAPEAEIEEQAVADNEVSQNQSEAKSKIAEYRALVNAPDENEKPSVAQSLVEEASRAERMRQQSRQAAAPSVEQGRVSEVFEHTQRAAETDSTGAGNLNGLPEEVAPSVAHEVVPEHNIELDETPIEPGSGGPDLAALVKQANDRRKSLAKSGEGTSGTDFIAAARRAAQAAAEEASAAHIVADQEEGANGGLLSSIPGLFSKRKKAVTMVAAGALIAAIAVPMVSDYVEPVSNEHVASISSSEPVVADEMKPDSMSVESNEVELASAEPANGNDELVVPVIEVDENTLDAESPTDYSRFASEIAFGNSALKEAILNGEGPAFHEVARRFTEGLGVEKDLVQAAVWYERAADLDYAPSQYMVANFREKGVGVERDLSIAANWYERAADNGNVVSMHNLAVLYATPNAISPEPNMGSAFEWFKMAAEHGVRDSQVNLGIFYTKGVGTSVNLPEAYKWFTIAAKAGDADAESKRDVIAEALRPDQLEESKTSVENWRPSEYKIAANRAEPAVEWLDDSAPSPLALNKATIAKTQELLTRIGYDTGPADGIMGAKTKDAIARFQQRVGLDINGQISIELLRELEAIAI